MRVLYLHTERFSWEVKEPALDIRDEPVSGGASNALVVFTTVERGDVPEEGFLRQIARDIVEVAEKVKASSIVIYPYAHLSNELARPYAAREIVNKLYEVVKSEFRGEVYKAPFGYYKAFELKCLGHPLSELSRSFKPGDSRAEKKAEERRDLYIVITPSGEEHDPAKFNYDGYEDLKILVEKEVFKRELGGGSEPRYLEYMRKFGFEWEPMSDVGHMRYAPEATLMMELVEDYAYAVAKSLGIPVFKIRGTNMFKLSERAIESHARLFGERLYIVESDTDLILRYAACFQQFAMVKDWVISYRQLPFGMLEVADSYRLEQPGETVLLFRLRRFYMPDLHIFTKDLAEAMEVTFRLHEAIFREIGKLGRTYVSLYNVTEDFYKAHRQYLVELARREGKPILVRVLPGQKYYWVLNVEFHIIDELGRPREIATFQIDVGNAQRFGIKYVDENNQTRYPVIIHTAILGSVERYLYAVFDTLARAEKEGKAPRLPTWLSPVQVRIIPITRDNLKYAVEVADKFEAEGIRVDVDDRDETLSKRIRDAEVAWVPYICVVGSKEEAEGVVSVRERGGGQYRVKPEDLIKKIREDVRGYPNRPLYMPRFLSQRPTRS
ncbi:threonine--tRNA ligase [Pyrobaculum neutrophilum]|uniref:Threonine--tRNA ligase n=1 Tax=Pyrobaculum neutrophilum (strain DSM 2338 / JCM 9278 / NBRC 100436 / V24Sta) TaxID=444157 RepID=SYT_PYRNV|nr:threonine--tRNA ligase [Pyrobaculum neutrophilum]B1YD09.1 RecName: Full=Threonine--tRNA ligase; AltName: Full=Threonyl-tRNA synthetase; Short=ThrRS [Pyrobaculum neutrophilum V24Sta]ACB39672.1 Threonyl-tRNA synthetase editing domain protein [Pyrobaculum neutrophilum V24Sta]